MSKQNDIVVIKRVFDTLDDEEKQEIRERKKNDELLSKSFTDSITVNNDDKLLAL